MGPNHQGTGFVGSGLTLQLLYRRAYANVTQGLTLHGRHSIKGMQRYISNTFRSVIQLETRRCTLWYYRQLIIDEFPMDLWKYIA